MKNFIKNLLHRHNFRVTKKGRCTAMSAFVFARNTRERPAQWEILECDCGKRKAYLSDGQTRQEFSADYIENEILWNNSNWDIWK